MGVQPEDLAPPTRDESGHWSLIICPQTRGVAAKTGAMGDSVVLDCKWQQWMTPLWAALAGPPRGKPVWTFACPELTNQFTETCSQLGAPAVPYMMRRSGPSIDRALQFRPLDEVRKRGRWASRKSVVRYEKAARLSKAWHDLPLASQRRCEALDARLEELLLRGAGCGARSTARRRRGQYVGDFFAGEGGVARAGRRLGVPVRTLEVRTNTREASDPQVT
ncbi:unnamed protein product [Prorocentrum cordatum]|uniref:Uncharacterized protein n=1 Tax=Prorocentrum cordatum TaxID=2364126 RepID=A0ABN9XTB2_9DINO|nr:unnamed protein product [Polarella glacialis]